MRAFYREQCLLIWTNREDISAMKKKIEEYEKRIKSLERFYHIDNAKEVEFEKEYKF